MDFCLLVKLVKAAIKFAKTKWGKEVEIGKMDPINNKTQYFKALNDFFEDKVQTEFRCAIIGVGGKIEHWTVVHNATSETLKVFDGEMRQISKSNCIVGTNKKKYELLSDEVIGLSRQKGNKRKRN